MVSTTGGQESMNLNFVDALAIHCVSATIQYTLYNYRLSYI